MIYFLSPKITTEMQGMWSEGQPYAKEKIYEIKEGTLPPVNYDLHKIKSHSLTHAEAPKHTDAKGPAIDSFFENTKYFFGKAVVVRLKGQKYKRIDKNKNIFHWEVSKEELIENLAGNAPEKLLLTTDQYPRTKNSPFHDPAFVLTLSQEAANWLVSHSHFHLYGTSWKSSDYCPGSNLRPIHNTLFKNAIIVECLDLEKVPAGEYLYIGVPLPIEGASESPLCPILVDKDFAKSTL